MRAFFRRLWNVFCVPLTITAIAVVMKLMMVLSKGALQTHSWVMVLISLAGIAVGMWFLRKTEKRILVRSSIIACVISLVIQLMAVLAIRNAGFVAVYGVLVIYTTPLFWPTMPLVDIFGEATSVLLAAILLETVLPMVFAFSGIFSRKKK